MLHLFNKVYLDFDSKIEINLDRVVISEQNGYPIYQALGLVAQGELFAFEKSLDSIAPDFIAFLISLKDKSDTTGKKLIVYCDIDNYKKFIMKWFKLILPYATFNEFITIYQHHIYNQRIISNSPMTVVSAIDLNYLWNHTIPSNNEWEQISSYSPDEITRYKIIKEDFKFSYEFLITDYLSGSTQYKEQLRSTMHMFLLRWFKEILTDNRQTVLLQLTNHFFQTSLGIDPITIDITQIDPLSNIPKFQYYADDEIWERNETAYGRCNLAGLSTEKLDGLINTLVTVYQEFEGMKIDISNFKIVNWIHYAASEYLTDEQLEEILEFLVQTPGDTLCIPKHDCENVNFPLIAHFLSEKYKQADLSRYRLM